MLGTLVPFLPLEFRNFSNSNSNSTVRSHARMSRDREQELSLFLIEQCSFVDETRFEVLEIKIDRGVKTACSFDL